MSPRTPRAAIRKRSSVFIRQRSTAGREPYASAIPRDTLRQWVLSPWCALSSRRSLSLRERPFASIGMATANSMAALVAGAVCVHATAIGIGERVGNTQMDQMLVNLKLMGIHPWADQ